MRPQLTIGRVLSLIASHPRLQLPAIVLLTSLSRRLSKALELARRALSSIGVDTSFLDAYRGIVPVFGKLLRVPEILTPPFPEILALLS